MLAGTTSSRKKRGRRTDQRHTFFQFIGSVLDLGARKMNAASTARSSR
ncbi:MAG: hypothetical protein R2845_13085 [Thermomicrobiales bacterium]